jgi:hypothetical protein
MGGERGQPLEKEIPMRNEKTEETTETELETVAGGAFDCWTPVGRPRPFPFPMPPRPRPFPFPPIVIR